MTPTCFLLTFFSILALVLIFSLIEFMTHKLKDERMLVKTLRNYELSNEKIVSRKGFEELLERKGILFKQNTNELISDSIAFEYIYDGQNEKNKEDKKEIFIVTKSGRELLNTSGFLEETLKRRRRLTLLVGGTIAILVSILISSDAEIRFCSNKVNSSYGNVWSKNFVPKHIGA